MNKEECPLSEMITTEDALYSIGIVEAICNEVGPGLPGTPQERARANMLKSELEYHLGTGNVNFEEFTLAPDAFLGSYSVSAVLMLIAAILNLSYASFMGVSTWIAAFLALAFCILALFIIILEYNQYKEFIDRFFPEKRSVNVIGTLRSAGTKNVKRLLIISGHHDSAPANTWITFLRYGFFASIPTIFIGLFLMIAKSATQLVGIITGKSGILRLGTLGWGIFVFPIIPAILFAFFFSYGKRKGGVVPGAADNLSACASIVAMCRFLARNPGVIPTGTEIRFVSFGGEEAGLRGSRCYVERHKEELKRLDARLLNYEVITYPEISILTHDVNGVKNSPEMVRSLQTAAERAGVPYVVTNYPLGGGASDAGSFSKAGLKAATIFPCKFPEQIVAFYHQKRDTPEVLTIDPLLNVMNLSLEWIRYGGE
jgi:hypothetical protein